MRPTLNTVFRQDPNNGSCQSRSVNSSRIGFAPLDDPCDNGLPIHGLTTAEAAAGARVLSLTYAEKTPYFAMTPAAVTGDDRIHLAKNTSIYFGAAGGPYTKIVRLARDVTFAGGVAQDVPIYPLMEEILATDVARLGGITMSPEWQDLSLQNQDNQQDASRGEDFFDSTEVTSRVVTITYNKVINTDSLAYRHALYPHLASPTTEIYVVLKRNVLPTIGGIAKIVSPNYPAPMKGLAMLNSTIQLQGRSLIYPTLQYRDMPVGSEMRSSYEEFNQLAGLPLA